MRNNYGPLRPNIYVNSHKWNVNTLCLPRKLCHSRNNLSCFPLYYIKYLYNSVAAVLLIHLFPQVSISNLLLQRKPRKSWCLCNNLPSSVTWFWIGHHDTGLLNTFLRSFVTSRYASGWGCKAQTQVGLHLPWQRLCPSPHTASLGSVENALFLILLLTVSYTERKFGKENLGRPFVLKVLFKVSLVNSPILHVFVHVFNLYIAGRYHITLNMDNICQLPK